MKIYILGYYCEICDSVEEQVWNVVEKNEISATIKRFVQDTDIVKFGVRLTPALIIGDERKVMGRIPQKKEVVSWVMAEKEKQMEYVEPINSLPSCVDQTSRLFHY